MVPRPRPRPRNRACLHLRREFRSRAAEGRACFRSRLRWGGRRGHRHPPSREEMGEVDTSQLCHWEKAAPGQSLREPSASAYPIPSQSAASSQVSFMVTTAPTSQLPFTLPSFPEVSISKIPRTSTSTMQTQATPSTLASTSAANLSSLSSALPQQVSTRKAAPPV